MGLVLEGGYGIGVPLGWRAAACASGPKRAKRDQVRSLWRRGRIRRRSWQRASLESRKSLEGLESLCSCSAAGCASSRDEIWRLKKGICNRQREGLRGANADLVHKQKQEREQRADG